MVLEMVFLIRLLTVMISLLTVSVVVVFGVYGVINNIIDVFIDSDDIAVDSVSGGGVWCLWCY